ncbi:FtsW/RodA/SpoVE family cell cycle protein [Luteococcus sp. Sow4_B9]|uniref:FtsW/RodA/SpoVE family cell cycle protein n=1 Tax=Luteococcus sp. Sow4_B9 TaxID=3438792 RepID=UPI003F9D2F86
MLAAPMASWYLVLVSSTLLIFLGALMVLSSSSVYSSAVNQGNPYFIAQRQLLFLAMGLPFAWWLSRQSEARLKVLGWVAFIGSLVLLLAIFVPGLGNDAGKGNLAWLRIGPISLQPSEFAKLGLVMWSAAVVSTKERVLDRPRELVPLLCGFALVELLVLAQKDLGTGLVIGAICFSILFVIGVPIRMLGALVSLAAIAIIGLVVTSPNRMRRIAAFVSGGGADDPNASQQPISAIYALASGGWWGLGLGRSRQKWGNLNDGAQNDFVFAVLGEEMGLLGTLSVLALFAVLGYAGIRIAMRADSILVRVLAAGTTSWILFQALVNIGVAMKLLPVVGVPLPFISAGGSALMANLFAVAVLLACARQEPAARRQLARKAGEPRPKVTTVVDGGR